MGLDMYLVAVNKVPGMGIAKYAEAFDLLFEASREVLKERWLYEAIPTEPLKVDLEEKLDTPGANVLKESISFRALPGRDGTTAYLFWPWLEVGQWRKANAVHRWFVDNVQDGEDDCGYYEVSRDHLIELRDLVVEALEAYRAGDFAGCETALPTMSGFFFGGTEYDEGYESDLDETLTYIDKAVEQIEAGKMMVYHSSW